MEEMETTSRQERLSQAKQKIKAWEGEYKSTHGCTPNRGAMTGAPDEVKAAYRTYHHYRRTLENLPLHSDNKNVEIKKAEGEGFVCSASMDRRSKCVALNISLGNDVEKPMPFDADNSVIEPPESILNSMIDQTLEKTVKADKTADKTGNPFRFEGKNSSNGQPQINSSAVWGSHLNKFNTEAEIKEKNKQISLYSKMAEKLRASSSVKMRTSLKRPLNTSSQSKPPSYCNETRTNSDDECSIQKEKSEESLVTSNKTYGLQGNIVEKENLDQETQSSVENNEQMIERSSLGEPTGSSIFDTLECNTVDAPVTFSTKQRNKKQYSSMAVSIVSPLTILNKNTETPTIKKRSSLNPGWVARCTGTTVPEINEYKGKDVPSDGWKMKLVDKEYVEGESDSEADTSMGHRILDAVNMEPDVERGLIENGYSSPSLYKTWNRRNPVQKTSKKCLPDTSNGQAADVDSERNCNTSVVAFESHEKEKFSLEPKLLEATTFDFDSETCNKIKYTEGNDNGRDNERNWSIDEVPNKDETGKEADTEIRYSRSRKRKKETLEELEESGKIQSVWPPPKKKRIARVKSINPNSIAKTKKKEENSETPVRVQRQSRRKQVTKSKVKSKDDSEKETQKLAIPDDVYDETQDIDTHGKKSIRRGKWIAGEERIQKKISSGSLNNNFVRINLKKKTYVRGKKTMTAAKYKRQEWKKKQSMKNAEKGDAGAVKSLTCFRCGDFGHWAKKCPGKIGDSLMPLEEYSEKESTFLSLEDAAAMAVGIKPNNNSEKPTTRVFSFGSESGDHQQSTQKNNEEMHTTTSDVLPNKQILSQSLEVSKNSSFSDEHIALVSSCYEKELDIPIAETGDMKEKEFSKNSDELNDSDDDIFADMDMDVEEKDTSFASAKQNMSCNSVNHSNGMEQATSFVNNFARAMVDPLYSLVDGKMCPTPEEVYGVLKMFGYSSFRPGQEEAIMRVLSGQSTLLVLSTGSGKSLCYQLPALLFARHRSPCITLCVSPLVSLMEDQVTGLPGFLKAVCLHTHQNTTQRSRAMSAIQNGSAHILLVSPEAVVASRSGGILGTLLKELPPVAFACLDEAHCVSEWSHNFRPSYLRVCQVLRERLGVRTILGLTATARHFTALSIAQHLHVPDFDMGIIRGKNVPDNLQLSVSRDQHRDQALVTLLQGDRFSKCSSIIIYCTRRDECEKVATLIRMQLLEPSRVDVKSNLKKSRGISFDAEAYHAGLSSHRRQQVQKRFMSGKLRIVVATVAFGMGIDKSDVRGIIHYNMPKNIESYVQEIGRAGRDGKDAHCHLFLDAQDGTDIQELKRHIYANSLDRHTVRKLLDKIFKPCRCVKVNSLVSGDSLIDTDSSGEVAIANKNIDVACSDIVPADEKTRGTSNTSSLNSNDHTTRSTTQSSCPKHEVAIPIDDVVEELDLPEENLETLLCYLDLHQSDLIHINSHVYANCTVSCYGGPRQLVAVSRRCPPLAVAIALERQKGISFDNKSRVTFPVVEVASRMGWNSKIVKRELKALEWDTRSLARGGKIKKSGVMVEFTDLSFHMDARGDLNNDERDQVLDAVFSRCQTQERDQLHQLMYTYKLLRQVSHNSIMLCCDAIDLERCEKLRLGLRQYFSEESKNMPNVHMEEKLYVRPEVEAGVRGSVRALLATHTDQQWTGRAVARVFHGIGSPNFPSEVWGRVRRFWRQHLNIDFNNVVKFATQEILRCK